MIRIKSQKDCFSGVMFVVAGVAFAIGAGNYNVGNGTRMGPGYFPMMIGVILAILGSGVILGSLIIKRPDCDPIGSIAWKPLSFIIGSNLLFGVLLGGLPSIGVPAMGLILGLYALVIVASMAGAKFSLKSSLILATVLAIGSYLTFIIGLSLQFPVWPSFIN